MTCIFEDGSVIGHRVMMVLPGVAGEVNLVVDHHEPTGYIDFWPEIGAQAHVPVRLVKTGETFPISPEASQATIFAWQDYTPVPQPEQEAA